MTRIFCSFLLLLWAISLQSQNTAKSFTVKKINEVVSIDGVRDEGFWSTADSADNFQQYFPADSVLAEQTTVIKMFYDATNLYIGIVVKGAGNDWVVHTLKRDFRHVLEL